MTVSLDLSLPWVKHVFEGSHKPPPTSSCVAYNSRRVNKMGGDEHCALEEEDNKICQDLA